MAKTVSKKKRKTKKKSGFKLLGPFKPVKSKKRKKRGKKKASQPQGLLNNVFFYIFVVLIIYALFGASFEDNQSIEMRSISDVIYMIHNEEVQNITVDNDKVEVMLRDGTKFASEKETSISFDQILANNNIDRSKIAGKITIKKGLDWGGILLSAASLILPLLVIMFIFKQMKGAGGDVMAFGQSKAKLFDKKGSKMSFKDVAGAEEAKKDLFEIVDFLKHPEKYRKLGARIPRGVLLVGASGVGKTLLAKAVAGEAEVPFFTVAGSEFMEMLVGVGSARARDLFKKAKAAQPALIFIDEIDAIGRQRGMGIGGGHDEREQTLNQILVEMDGFDARTNVIVIAATNRPDMLDSALIRPGRFDRKINIPLPDLKDREEIIKIHARGKPIAEGASLEKLAKRTVGFSGADLENMLNEAAILAARENKTQIEYDDLEEAALKVTMGSVRRTIQTDEEKKMTAYHEAGHALVATNMPDMDPVHQISIVPRGGSLGHTAFPPERDRYNETQTRLLSIIATMLGGRAAEEIVFNELTIGASDDIKRATELTRKMVTEYGMSALGPINFNGHQENGWLARELNHGPEYGQEMASRIDAEVSRIIDESFIKAKAILNEKRVQLDKVSEALIQSETVRSEEYLSLIS